MKIKNMSVKNKQVDLKGIDIDFSNNGVYLIKGANGSGKTSLIEEIIFNWRNATFLNEKQLKSFQKDKYNLFTYIPQRIISTSISVKQYIYKGNRNIDISYLNGLLMKFGFDLDILNQNFKTLSGGEKEKIAIICGLLKDTPYIFMDEPTNNLDDQSVGQFICLIEELSKTKTVIIVTHDPRLNSEQYTNIMLENNVVVENNKNAKNVVNKGYQDKNKTNFIKLGIGLFKNFINYITLFATISVLVMLSLYTQAKFESEFSTDKVPEKNIILSYQSDYVYGDLNKMYVEEEQLKIDENNIYTMLSYDDIPSISNIGGVEKLLLADYEYLDKLSTEVNSGNSLDSLNIFSLPAILSEDFAQRIMIPYNLDFLESGRLPKDDSSEVTISKSLLKKFYGYTDENVDDSLGDSIMVNNKSYTIVGLYYFDICIVSYEEKNGYGFYEYDPDTYSDFKERNLNYKISIDGLYPQMTNEVIIFTSKGKEKSVLNYLFENYPANNYYSNEYVKSWVKGFNSEFIKKVIFINVLFAAVNGIALLIINKNNYTLLQKKIYDYENYYVDRKKIKTIYILFLVIQYCAILFISILINNMLNSFSYISNFITIINVIVISVFVLSYPIFTTYFIKREKEKKE